MTDQLSPLAVQNAPLLRALKESTADSPATLAEMAGIVPNNLHRKLESLENEGLIVRDPDGPKHVAALTDAAERALGAIAFYEGTVAVPGDAGAGLVDGDVSYIPFGLIDPWDGNPRTQFSDVSVEEMAQSIADKGIVQPLVVRRKGDRFEVIVGERRRRGATLAVKIGLLEPGFLIPARLRDYTEDEALEVAGVENLQREDLHWMDEAKFYLTLMNRGKSAEQIERLVGGRRRKRSIQDYAKCARELTAEDIARTYLPDGDANQLTYVRARDMTGEKKEKPALDLPPRLALALMELVEAACAAADAPIHEGAVLQVDLARAPNGGPLIALSQDKRLIDFTFRGAVTVARVKVTEAVWKWLGQVGYLAASDAGLLNARAAVVGEMQAARWAPGQYHTPELNQPEVVTPPAQVPSPPPVAPPTDDEDDDGDDTPPPTVHQAEAAVVGSGAPSAEPVSGLADGETRGIDGQAKSVPPMLQIVLVELAHAIAANPARSPMGGWGVEIRADYYKDQRGAQLIQEFKFMAFVPAGMKTLAVMPKAALDWLAQTWDVITDADGLPVITDAELASAQAALGIPAKDARYSTFWLNPVAEEKPPAEAAAPAAPEPPPAAAGQPAKPDAFGQQLREVAAEHRALNRARHALNEAAKAVATARSRKLTGQEAGALQTLIDQALEIIRAATSAED